MLRHLDAERSFSALILDMDGLMIDTEAVEFRSWTRAADEFGWSFSVEQHAQLLGRTNQDCWALMTAWWDERPASRTAPSSRTPRWRRQSRPQGGGHAAARSSARANPTPGAAGRPLDRRT